MSVVVSLLRAIDRADGEALVMHVGEKPYVVTASGHAELAANALTVPAMTGMLDQLLPPDSRKALNELGAVEYHLPPDQAAPGTQYSVVAARGGNDIWIEVRRRKVAEAASLAMSHHVAVAVEEPPPPRSAARPRVAGIDPRDLAALDDFEPLGESDLVTLEPAEPMDFPEPETIPVAAAAPEALEEPVDRFELRSPIDEDFETDRGDAGDDLDDEPPRFDELPTLDFSAQLEPEPVPVPAAVVAARVNVRFETPAAPVTMPPPRVPPMSPPPVASVPKQPVVTHADPLHHLLYVAAGHGASALYVAPEAKPSLRVDGEIRVLDESPLSESQLETSLHALLKLPEGAPLPVGEIETREVADVGRVQYLGFRDHRGLGAMFRMLPGRAISSEQAGLSAGIQALCTEPEGLVLVAGARSAGKSTLVAALVDQINRTRRDHVITIEGEIQFVHENRTSFISQREARDDDRFVESVRAALREAPDVLIIDGAMNPEVASLTLQAAVNGHLVVASLAAPTTASALERFISFFGQDTADARGLLGEHLRGVVTQALLRKTGGGRAAAREVLVNVPSVAALVANAQFDQIPSVINSGRRVGMTPLNDALVGLVQSGALDVRQAYRKAPDQAELLNLLSKAGFDTTFAEKLG